MEVNVRNATCWSKCRQSFCKVSWNSDKKQNSSWTLYVKFKLSSRNRKCRNRKLTKSYSDVITTFYKCLINFFATSYRWLRVLVQHVSRKKNSNKKLKSSWTLYVNDKVLFWWHYYFLQIYNNTFLLLPTVYSECLTNICPEKKF